MKTTLKTLAILIVVVIAIGALGIGSYLGTRDAQPQQINAAATDADAADDAVRTVTLEELIQMGVVVETPSVETTSPTSINIDADADIADDDDAKPDTDADATDDDSAMTVEETTTLVENILTQFANVTMTDEARGNAVVVAVDATLSTQGRVLGADVDLGEIIAEVAGITIASAGSSNSPTAGAVAPRTVTTIDATTIAEWNNTVVPTMQMVTAIIYCQVTTKPTTESVFQWLGLPNADDGTTLFSIGTPVIGMTDRNGHGDASNVLNGRPFAGEREMAPGFATFTVSQENVGRARVHFNLLVYAPQGAVIDGAPGTWNFRAVHANEGNQFGREVGRMTAEQWFINEKAFGQVDPAFFALYEASEGEVINLAAIHQQLRADGAYTTLNHQLPALP